MTEALAIGGLVVLAASAVVYVVSASSLWKLVRAAKAARATAFTPPVTIVKPLCGTDEGLETNLESFFRLDYPTGAIEVIFSMASAEDPAAAVARRVADRYPGIPSTFVFDAREPGGNAKVNRLEAALRHARFRLILFSDGNVRVRPDFLRRAVAEFEDPGVGLVSHLFRATGAVSFGSRLEALYLNGCLQPGTAAIERLLKMPCVVGKSILISRRVLDGIGGISILRDFLAEDYLLGRRVVDAGYGVVLSGDMLDTTEVRKPAHAAWARHRRWAMMRRRLGGPLYAAELLTSPLPWFGLAMLSSSPFLRASAGVLLATRWGWEAWTARRTGRPLALRDLPLLPIRDIAAAAVFWAGVAGRSVDWRGHPLRIGRETRILGPAAWPATVG